MTDTERAADKSWASRWVRDGNYWTIEWGGGLLTRAEAIAEASARALSPKWHGDSVWLPNS